MKDNVKRAAKRITAPRKKVVEAQKEVDVQSKPQDYTNFHSEIALKAYELFERRGYEHGNDLADWYEAERIVKAQKAA